MDGERALQVDVEDFDRETALAPPPTADDVTVLHDGRRLDSVDAVLAWLHDPDPDRSAAPCTTSGASSPP